MKEKPQVPIPDDYRTIDIACEVVYKDGRHLLLSASENTDQAKMDDLLNSSEIEHIYFRPFDGVISRGFKLVGGEWIALAKTKEKERRRKQIEKGMLKANA